MREKHKTNRVEAVKSGYSLIRVNVPWLRSHCVIGYSTTTLTRSLPPLLAHSLAHSLPCSLARSLPHSLTHQGGVAGVVSVDGTGRGGVHVAEETLDLSQGDSAPTVRHLEDEEEEEGQGQGQRLRGQKKKVRRPP